MLREFHPAALVAFSEALAGRDALAVLAIAPSPQVGKTLTVQRITTVLRRAGRQRNLAVAAEPIQGALSTEQLSTRPGVEGAYAASVTALVAVIAELVRQTTVLDGQPPLGCLVASSRETRRRDQVSNVAVPIRLRRVRRLASDQPRRPGVPPSEGRIRRPRRGTGGVVRPNE